MWNHSASFVFCVVGFENQINDLRDVPPRPFSQPAIWLCLQHHITNLLHISLLCCQSSLITLMIYFLLTVLHYYLHVCMQRPIQHKHRCCCYIYFPFSQHSAPSPSPLHSFAAIAEASKFSLGGSFRSSSFYHAILHLLQSPWLPL